MAESPLKAKLQSCANGPFQKTNFSIGHRGAPLMFPEHTQESYEAAARMGAGVLECDVTFTKDKQLVCRHAQNDLHTTTNILATALAAKCTKPFTPYDAETKTPATAECRTSDITLAEFKTLRGKMDAFNPMAKTVQEFMDGTAKWRTDLYSGPTSGTLLTHAESIALFKKLGTKMTPELKSASVKMPFDGFTQEAYAQKMLDEYKAANVPASDVGNVQVAHDGHRHDARRHGIATIYQELLLFPELTVAEWWQRLGASGWAAPALPTKAYGKGVSRNDAIAIGQRIVAKGAVPATATVQRDTRLQPIVDLDRVDFVKILRANGTTGSSRVH